MATQSGSIVWAAVGLHVGNSAFPTLPQPGDPSVGKTAVAAFGASHPIRSKKALVQRRNAGGAGVFRGFAGWYLDTIWTTEQPVDFASLAADKDVEVTVHNTRRSTIELQSIELIAGLQVLSPVLPLQIEPFSSQVVTLRATLEGPDSFDELLDWTYDVETVEIRTLGRRVLFFTAQPEAGVKEQLVFKTDIIRVKSGKEKAQALRLAPRSVVRMKFRLNDDTARSTLHNLVFGGSPKLRVGRQSWWEARLISQAVASSSSTVNFDTTNAAYRVGDIVAFALPDGTFAEGEILSMTDSSVTLTDTVGTDLPLGTYATPLRFGYITGYPSLDVFPVNLEDMVVEFTTDDETDVAAVSGDEFDLHPTDGLPVIRANYMGRGEKPASISRRTEELDSVTGIMFSTGSEPMGDYGTQVLAVLQSAKAVWDWRRFLHHLKGSWGRFYLPTFQNDLPLAVDLALGGAIFDVPNMGIKRYLDGRAPKRDLRVVVSTGEVYYRRIQSVTDNGATERITLESGIPGIGTSPVAETTISWLHLCRLAGDVATFTHERPGLAVLEFNVGTVKE